MANYSDDNPWYGEPGAHRIAALMRWGVIPRGPIKRRRKRKGVRGRRGVLASLRKYMKNEPRRRIFMARRRKYDDNAWYGEPGRHRVVALMGWRKRRRKYDDNPRVRYRARRRRKYYDNPRYRRYRVRRYRKNPAADFAGVFQQIMNVGDWLPLAVTGGLSVTTAAVVPNMIAPVMVAQPTTGPLVKYGIQLVTSFGGGVLVENFVNRRHANAWVITGVAYIGYQLLRDWVFKPFMPQLAVGLGEYEQYYSAQEPYQQVGASASSYGVSAFPEEVSAFPEEVSAYPYDGRYGY